MAKPINEGRWTANIEGDFVVFLIGPRLNSKLHVARSVWRDYWRRVEVVPVAAGRSARDRLRAGAATS